MFSHPAGFSLLRSGGADLLSSSAPTLMHLQLIQANLQRLAPLPAPGCLHHIYCNQPWVPILPGLDSPGLTIPCWSPALPCCSSDHCLKPLPRHAGLIRICTHLLSCALLTAHVQICENSYFPCLGPDNMNQYEELRKYSHEDAWLKGGFSGCTWLLSLTMCGIGEPMMFWAAPVKCLNNHNSINVYIFHPRFC